MLSFACFQRKRGSVFGRLLLIFILVPLVELALLTQLYERMGLLSTVLAVILTGVIGVQLARAQGLRAWRAIHMQMAKGATPSVEILNGVMILIAGAFLITPGVLTDGVGFLLLVPTFRQWIGVRLFRWFKLKTVATFKSQWVENPTAPSEPFPDEEEQPEVRVVEPESSPENLSNPRP